MPQLPAPDYPADVRARLEADAKEIIARYPDCRSALLPLLHLVQSEEGYVTRTGMRFCAELLGLTTAEVTAVATFYSMYRRKPSGDYQVGVCTNTLCAVMGGDAIFEPAQGAPRRRQRRDHRRRQGHPRAHRVQRGLRLRARRDGQLGVLRQPDAARARSASSTTCRAGAPVEPTRGAPLCTYKETARILAGFPDERDGAVEASGGAGPASLIGLRLAKGETRPARVVHPRGEAPAGRAAARPGPPSTSAPTTHRSRPSASDPDHPAGPAAEEGE